MLTVDAVSVRYGDRLALDGVSVDVADGEVVCVLGPSGSGKSTLLRVVAGLVAPATGRVRWDGRDLAGVPAHRRGFGLMFQDHALFPHRDVGGNVAFGPRMQRSSATATGERVAETLALVRLAGFGHRAIASLSGGEQQRVALARALAPRPRLLMLDEPLGSLDRALRDELVVELRDLLTRLRTTALHVTHDHEEAFALGDRLVVMRDGRVEQAGTPAELWQRPSSAFVAGFLGIGTVLAAGELSRWGVAAPCADLVVVRPAALRLSADGAVAGVVRAARFRGGHTLLTVATDAGLLAVEATPGATVTGDTVRLALDGDGVVALPPAGGGGPAGPSS